ncbi:MAG TPA: hypothetical protein VKA48_04590 [Gammaproteobacteria bacterium]|nr:hypothetical protein [Gammaproteobacteria bacterium]
MGLALAMGAGPSEAGGYLGVGAWDSRFYGSEYDRDYKSDTNRIRSLRFGWQNRDLAGLFGDVSFDEQDEVRDWALGLVMNNYLVHVEQGRISGDIVTDNGSGKGAKIGEFDNRYLGVNVLRRTTVDGYFSIGLGYQKFAMPILFKYGTSSSGDYKYIQDDAVQFQHFGFGIYGDPIRNYLLSDTRGGRNTWYFATNLVVGVARAVTSDAPEMAAHGVDGEEFYLYGASGSYELGWFFGARGENWGLAANVGYHVRAVTMVDYSRFADYSDPEKGEILPPEAQLILHGPRAEIRVVF